GSLCIGTPKGWPINPAVAIPLLAALLLGLANPENLVVISNILSRLYGVFVKGKEKKHAPGIVYDAATGLPIANVIIMLFRARDKKLIHTVKSDKNGRFALETPPGEEYYVEIERTGYDLMKNIGLPNISLAYDQNYFATNIFRPSESEKLFDKALPVSANDLALAEVKKFKIRESISKILRIANLPLIIFGLTMSLVAYFKYRSVINLITLCLYGAIIIYYIMRWLILSGRGFGKVYSIDNNKGIELATVNLISEVNGKLKATVVSDAKGRFIVAIPKGFYRILVSKPGYVSSVNQATRIKSSFKPTRIIIGMNKIQKSQQVQTAPAIAAPPLTNTKQIADSAEIIEKYNQKRTKFGTANLADVGVHHLINQNIKNSDSAEFDTQLKVPKDEEIIKPEKPNWNIPGPRTPL
ncbi:MAG: carboxypeptidase-like regulatory domain-containing protein, partial [Candidatus Berkelbacteria bacterium]|nr:carboxypeptidase-like regulatory domain-containing protein [Candidatus Berkelbacteria bacterium]